MGDAAAAAVVAKHHVRISNHADLQALQDRSDERMFIKLVSLESVRTAIDSYALLRNLIERRRWLCPRNQMDLLSLVAGVAVELDRIKHDLFPLLVVQEAKLEGDCLEALLLLKNSAITLLHLGDGVKEVVGSLVADDLLLDQLEVVGHVVKDTADLVLKGPRNVSWLQTRVPQVLEVVDVLSSTPVYFP